MIGGTAGYRVVHRTPLVAIGDWRCRRHDPAPGPEETPPGHQIVLTRAGVFRVLADGATLVADPATAVFLARGAAYRFGHPAPGGDRCVVLTLPDDLLEEIAGRATHGLGRTGDGGAGRGGPGIGPFPAASAAVDPAASLELRRLIAALAAGDGAAGGLAADERALLLTARVLRSAALGAAGHGPADRGPAGCGAHHAGPPRAGTAAHHRRVVERARLCAAERFRERLTLAAIAREAGASPYHLCRLFRRATGLSIHRYVNRLRLLEALDRVGTGADLAAIALDAGFSSHSHLSTAFRREFGAAPSRVLPGPAASLRQMRTILKAAPRPPV
jgi:AraC-like DNA-binding protein